MTPAIETTGLTHKYRSVEALKDVNLEVPEGSLFALLGPNGAGKTTLMKLVLGLLRPTSGEIRVRGKPVAGLDHRDRGWLGYVAEGQALPGWMTLAQCENYLAPFYPTWDRDLADHLRTRFRLEPDRPIKSLSRGQQMKAALLTALAPRPQLLIMDEPFTGMDALVKDELVYGLLELANTGDWTVFICSQDIGELEPLADHVAFLDGGKLVLSEPMDILRSRFKKVSVDLPPGTLFDLSSVPPTWLSPRRMGNRITFTTSEHGSQGFQQEVDVTLPEGAQTSTETATLREIFLALAQDELGGPGNNGRRWAS